MGIKKTARRERMCLIVSVYPERDTNSQPIAVLEGKIQTRRGGWCGSLRVVEADNRALCGQTLNLKPTDTRSARQMGLHVLARTRTMFPCPVAMVVGERAA